MVASSDPRWIQGAFNALVGLFDRVCLRNNIRKTVNMICRLFQAAGNHSEAAYGRRITRYGPTYRERQKGRVHCRDCGEYIAARSMENHMMTQHGRLVEAQWSWRTLATGDGPQPF